MSLNFNCKINLLFPRTQRPMARCRRVDARLEGALETFQIEKHSMWQKYILKSTIEDLLGRISGFHISVKLRVLVFFLVQKRYIYTDEKAGKQNPKSCWRSGKPGNSVHDLWRALLCPQRCRGSARWCPSRSFILRSSCPALMGCALMRITLVTRHGKVMVRNENHDIIFSPVVNPLGGKRFPKTVNFHNNRPISLLKLTAFCGFFLN